MPFGVYRLLSFELQHNLETPMATTGMPDPSQQQGPQQGPGAGAPPPQAGQGDPGAGAEQQQGPPPELQALGQLLQMCKSLAQQVPAASSGLAKAIDGINEAASAVMTQPQQQGPQMSPPY